MSTSNNFTENEDELNNQLIENLKNCHIEENVMIDVINQQERLSYE
jgi:hypothetical protein